MLSGPIEHSPYSYVHFAPDCTVLHSAIVIVAGAGGLPCGPGGFSCVGGLQPLAPVTPAPAVAATRTNGVMKLFRVRIAYASKSCGVIESRTARQIRSLDRSVNFVGNRLHARAMPRGMGDQEHAPKASPSAAAAPARAAPAPAPKPNEPAHVAEIRREVKQGAAVVAWLRDSALPTLRTVRAGILSSAGSQPELAARSGLATAKQILDRTQDAGNGPLFQQALELPKDLVLRRDQLEADYEAIKTEVDDMTAALQPRPSLERQKPTPAPHSPASQRVLQKQPEKPSSQPPQKLPTPVTYTAHVAGPPAFDFGRALPGTTHTLALPLFNLVPQQLATASVRYDGSAAISLRSAPTQLFGAGVMPPAGSQDIVLMFAAPTPRGMHRGTIRVDLAWANGVKPEMLVIPVIGHSLLAHEATEQEIGARKRDHDVVGRGVDRLTDGA